MLPDLCTQNLRLPGGLSAVTIALPHLHTASLVLYVKAGSRLESPADNGLSHFVEHMLFRGTQAYPSSYDINFAFEALGGTLHAETGRDYSLFQVTLMPDQLDRGVELFGELFSRPLFRDIELERALILEELNEDFDERGIEINSSDIARSLLFADHPLAQRIIGPIENVRRFTPEDVRRHFDRYYCAANAVLVAAGPVDHDQLVTFAGQHMAELTRGERAEAMPFASPGPTRFQHVHDSGSQCSIDVLFAGLAETDGDYLAMVALMRALDDGMSTRLHYRLCDQLGLAYSLGAAIEPLYDVSVFEITGATAPAKVPELIARLLDMLGELASRGIDEAELDKVKRRYRYDLYASVDDAGAMAGWFGGTSLYYSPQTLEQRALAMDAVTLADVQRAAGRVLTAANLCVVVVGPLSRARIAQVRQSVDEF